MEFSLDIKEAINALIEKLSFGINLQGQNIGTIRFANHIAVYTASKEEIERALNELGVILKEGYEPKINKEKRDKKGKIVTRSKIHIPGQKLLGVIDFCY